jgi:hypothetical protein
MPLKITREEFHEVYIQGEEATFQLFNKLVERINMLEEKVASLEARISKNSRNCSGLNENSPLPSGFPSLEREGTKG